MQRIRPHLSRGVTLSRLSHLILIALILATSLAAAARPASSQDIAPGDEPLTDQATATEVATETPTLVATTPPPTVNSVPTETATATPSATTAPASPTVSATFESAAMTQTAVSPATISIRTVDHLGTLAPGFSYEIIQDRGNGQIGDSLGLAIDGINGTPMDGIAELEISSSLAVVVRQVHVAKGYLPNTTDVPVSLVPGEVTSIEIVSPIGGKVIVHGRDELDQPTSHICAVVAVNDNGKRGAIIGRVVCDTNGTRDGTIEIDTIPPGSYLLGWGASTEEYAGGPDIPFTIGIGDVVEKTVQLLPTGTLLINKRTPTGEPLLDACFVTYRPGEEPNPAAEVCDSRDDGSNGIIQFRLGPGEHMVRETKAPSGYVRAADVKVVIESRTTTEITIVDPTASSLTVISTDLWGKLITPTCLTLLTDKGDGTPGSGVFTGCVNRTTASVTFKPLQPGKYLIRLDSTKAGYTAPQYVPVTVDLSQDERFKLRMNGPAPVFTVLPAAQNVMPTTAEIYWATDQPTVGSLAYGLTRELELAPPSPDAESRAHRFRLRNLLPGRTYYVQVRGTNGNGEVTSARFSFRTPPTTSTARLVVTKTNSDGSAQLGGSCFTLFKDAGSGRLGAAVWASCDHLDSVPDDGRLISGALPAGTYILMETVAPPGYTTARPLPITLAADRTTRLTVKDSRGGAMLTVLTKAALGDQNHPMLPGACYAVFKNVNMQPGELVSLNCDESDGLDGKTRLGNLRVGTYLVFLTRVPAGYHPGWQDPVWVEITSSTRSTSFDRVLNPLEAPGNAVVRTVDANGKLLTNACYALLQSGTGIGEIRSTVRCDGTDGRVDGRVYFIGIHAVRYKLVLVQPPSGYQTGTTLSFTKVAGEMRTLTIEPTAGGAKIRITTRVGNTTTGLPGACYVLIKGSATLVAAECDDDGDGVVELEGVLPGTYRLYQTFVPAGFWGAPSQSVTLETSSISLFIKTFPLSD